MPEQLRCRFALQPALTHQINAFATFKKLIAHPPLQVAGEEEQNEQGSANQSGTLPPTLKSQPSQQSSKGGGLAEDLMTRLKVLLHTTTRANTRANTPVVYGLNPAAASPIHTITGTLLQWCHLCEPMQCRQRVLLR